MERLEPQIRQHLTWLVENGMLSEPSARTMKVRVFEHTKAVARRSHFAGRTLVLRSELKTLPEFEPRFQKMLTEGRDIFVAVLGIQRNILVVEISQDYLSDRPRVKVLGPQQRVIDRNWDASLVLFIRED